MDGHNDRFNPRDNNALWPRFFFLAFDGVHTITVRPTFPPTSPSKKIYKILFYIYILPFFFLFNAFLTSVSKREI